MAFARTSRLLVPLTTVALTAGLSVAVAGAAPGARGFDPAGTQLLSSATSGFPDVAHLASVAPTGTVYSDTTGTWLKPSGGGGLQPLGGPGTKVIAAAANMLWILDSAGNKTWRNTSTGAQGTIARTWRVPSTTGGLYQLLSPSGAIHIINNNASNDRLTDLGAVGSWAAITDQLVPGPSGVLEVGRRSDGTLAMTYLTYTGGRRTPDLTGIPAQDTVRCVSVTAAYAGCFDNTTGAPFAVSLTSGAPTVGPTGSTLAAGPTVTATTLAWTEPVGQQERLHSIPLGGGAESVLSAPVVAAGSGLLSDGSLVYLSTAGDGATDVGSISTVPDATATPTVLHADPPLPLTVSELAIGAGRVAWADDSTMARPVWSRTDSDPGAVVLGPAGTIAGSPTPDGLYISGSRTAYSNSAHFPTFTDGTTTTALGQPGQVLALSGTRLMFLRDVGRHFAMYDIVNTSFIDLTSTYPTMTRNATPALWGNYLTFFKDDGSVWRDDLSTGAGPVNIAPAQPAGRSIVSGTVWESGDKVAWTLITTDGTSSYATNQYVDASTSNPPVGAPAGSTITGASAAGVMLLANGQYTLQSWNGANSMTMSGRGAVSDGNRVAWIGTDGLPRIAPVSFASNDQPRLLSPVVTATTLDTFGNWSLRVPTSAPLTNCAVAFLDSGGSTVDTEPCDPAAAALGDVRVDWTPPDGITFGTYTWQLNASNPDGSVLAADGTTSPTQGRVTLALSVTGVSPATVHQGATGVPVVVTGNRFDARTTVGFGGSITVTAVVVNSSHQLTATINVTPTAFLGGRTVTVSDRGSPDATLRNSFSVVSA